MTDWANRIVKYDKVSPQELKMNPLNWRIHPEDQKLALKDVLSRVGWVDDVIVNINTGNIIDGHLRVSMALEKGEKEIPVKYVDLSLEEERIILSTFDPIADMARTDREKFLNLMAEINKEDNLEEDTINDIMNALSLNQKADDLIPPDDFVEFDEDIETMYQCPKCGYEW